MSDTDLTITTNAGLQATIAQLQTQAEVLYRDNVAISEVADSLRAENKQQRAQIVAGVYDAASVGITLIKTDDLTALRADVEALKADATRVCDTPGCTAAVLRHDDGSRVCAAGHPSRWVERAEVERLKARSLDLATGLAHWQEVEEKLRAEVERLKDRWDAAQVEGKLTQYKRAEALEARIAELEAALERICCQPKSCGADMLAIARQALRGEVDR